MKTRLAMSLTLIWLLGLALVQSPGNAANKSTYAPIGGLTWMADAPVGSAVGSLRCTDSTWRSLPKGFSVSGRPDLQRFSLVSVGVPAHLEPRALNHALQAAGWTWSNEINDCGRPDQSSFTFVYAGTVGRVPLPEWDGKPTIMFARGVCDSPTHVACLVPHLDVYGRLQDWDVVLDPAYPWGLSPGPWLDVQAVVTHEIGHAVGLADIGRERLCDPEHMWLTMFSCTWPGDTVKRTLALGDALGVEVMSREQP